MESLKVSKIKELIRELKKYTGKIKCFFISVYDSKSKCMS